MPDKHKSNKEKGSEAEKYARGYLEGMGYLCDIHPRTSRSITTPHGFAWISSENDFFSCFDIIGVKDDSVVMVQVTSSPEDDAGSLTVQGGNVSTRRSKIDRNFHVDNPGISVLVFMAQKQWVSFPHRHKEYFHRAWERVSTDHGFVWVERKAWSNVMPQEKLRV